MKEGWTYKKLGEVAQILGGSTPKTDNPEFWDGGIYWVTPAELNGSKYITVTQRTITQKAVEKTNLSLLPTGTVLLSSRAPIGKVCITENPMYCNQGFKNIVCGNSLYNVFVYYYLKNNIDYLQSLGTGATFKEISKKVVEQIIIPIPPFPEQQKIVSELDLLSGVIEKQKAQIEELDKLAQSIFYDMFGDPVTNEKGWEMKKLGEVGKFINGDRGKNYPSQKDFIDNGIPFINAGHIKDNHVDLETMNYISREKFEKLGSGKIQNGDILFCLRGSLGKKAIVKNITEGAIASSLVIIRVIDANNIFISYYLESNAVKREIILNDNGSSQPNLSAKSVASFNIPVPPMDLQQLFASKIEAIEAMKAKVRQSLTESEQLFNSRMDYYFN